MANLFGNKQNAQSDSPRANLEAKYKQSRQNLLLVIIFTAINICLALFASGTYFLFSAYVPFFLAYFGMFATGKYPSDFYESNMKYDFKDSSFLVIMIAIAVAILAAYLLCYILSKRNKVVWLIVALVLFAVDSAVLILLTDFAVDSILDYAFHVWVIVALVNGIIAHSKLKKLPPDEPAGTEASVVSEEIVSGE